MSQTAILLYNELRDDGRRREEEGQCYGWMDAFQYIYQVIDITYRSIHSFFPARHHMIVNDMIGLKHVRLCSLLI